MGLRIASKNIYDKLGTDYVNNEVFEDGDYTRSQSLVMNSNTEINVTHPILISSPNHGPIIAITLLY